MMKIVMIKSVSKDISLILHLNKNSANTNITNARKRDAGKSKNNR